MAVCKPQIRGRGVILGGRIGVSSGTQVNRFPYEGGAPPPGVPSFKAPAIMCHLVREIPGGIEFRTRFWMGMRIIDRKAVRCIPDTVRIPDFVVKGLAVHNVGEYANLASFLPQIWAEEKGLVAA